jgi:hypothetical protein
MGPAHGLSVADLNRIAAICDFAGGHIRNVVLTAAVAAQREERSIAYADIVSGIAAECRKLGKQSPTGLAPEGVP